MDRCIVKVRTNDEDFLVHAHAQYSPQEGTNDDGFSVIRVSIEKIHYTFDGLIFKPCIDDELNWEDLITQACLDHYEHNSNHRIVRVA